MHQQPERTKLPLCLLFDLAPMFLSPKILLVASILIVAAATKACRVVDSSAIQDESQGDFSNNAAQVTNELTFLQKHAAFFDRNHDGIIYPEETFEGFRAIGCGIPLSTASAATIHAAFSPKTRPGEPSSPHLPIEVANIALAKHRSDSGAYDAGGNFVPSKFEEIFSKHARTHPNALTSKELNEMLSANRQVGDSGWLASEFEWHVLYQLAKDKDGLLQKDTVRGVYDGSLFEWLEKERASKH